MAVKETALNYKMNIVVADSAAILFLFVFWFFFPSKAARDQLNRGISVYLRNA